MFRAHRAHHQERQIVSIQSLVAVGGRVVCRSEVHSQHCTRHSHRHRVTATRGLLTQFVSPDDEHDVLETCRESKIKINT